METTEENTDDWVAECSDDENYKLTPADMIDLYERIARGDQLELDWKCPGRRSPTPERNEENVLIKEEVVGESTAEQKVVVAEFDFDELAISDVSAITPRRSSVGGAKTPRSNQKRVAQLDKIMNDMRRHRKMDEESRKTTTTTSSGHKGEGNSPRTVVNSRKASPKAT